jgi:hypothetical protein
MPVQQHPPCLDHHLATVRINGIPAEPHDLGTAQPAQGQPPRRCPLIPVGQRETAPPVRGVARTERIRKIAVGDLTYQQIADEEEVGLDAITQFASRNKEEIRLAKQALVADPTTSMPVWLLPKS